MRVLGCLIRWFLRWGWGALDLALDFRYPGLEYITNAFSYAVPFYTNKIDQHLKLHVSVHRSIHAGCPPAQASMDFMELTKRHTPKSGAS